MKHALQRRLARTRPPPPPKKKKSRERIQFEKPCKKRKGSLHAGKDWPPLWWMFQADGHLPAFAWPAAPPPLPRATAAVRPTAAQAAAVSGGAVRHGCALALCLLASAHFLLGHVRAYLLTVIVSLLRKKKKKKKKKKKDCYTMNMGPLQELYPSPSFAEGVKELKGLSLPLLLPQFPFL